MKGLEHMSASEIKPDVQPLNHSWSRFDPQMAQLVGELSLMLSQSQELEARLRAQIVALGHEPVK